jgi:hypothetical protein
LPAIRPLMENQPPEVEFAAARAAAFIGDSSAESALMQMALNDTNPFQLNAVQTLGGLPGSPIINQMLRRLLDGSQSLVRIAAYEVLARNKDNCVFSKIVGRNKFILDIVPSNGPPIIYATRTGVPRVAIIGDRASLTQPITFTAMDGHFSISSTDQPNRAVTLFQRADGLPRPVKMLSKPDIAEIVARLGGEGPVDEDNFDFSYGDVVSILQALGDSKRMCVAHEGRTIAAAFVLQDLPAVQDEINTAPKIDDVGDVDAAHSRPQGDHAPRIDLPPASSSSAR